LHIVWLGSIVHDKHLRNTLNLQSDMLLWQTRLEVYHRYHI